MRRFLVAGNWKMNGDAAGSAELVAGIVAGLGADDDVDVLVCPPFPYIAGVAERARDSALAVGGQDVCEHVSGAYTGEVSASMLKDIGCEYVIVGHSERRALYGESDAEVAAKFQAAQREGLVPILCVGETLDERRDGATEAVVDRQVAAVVAAAGIDAFRRAVVAYEPVWAIGTGEVATPEEAQAVHAHVRGIFAAENADVARELRILYGGSMKGENAPGLLAMPDIDGGLIGGASLAAGDFLAIVEAARKN